MAHNPDKSYYAAQVYAARKILAIVREKIVVLKEAEFFIDVDTLRDVIDPQGAAACVLTLLGKDIPQDLLTDPNVIGLIDEFEHMKKFPGAHLAIRTLFHDAEFRDLLKIAVMELQSEFTEAAGEIPAVLEDYFAGKILIS